MSFLILLYSLSCGSAWADLHIIHDPTGLVIPNGQVYGELFDAMSWLGPSAGYGSGVQYIGDSPVSGSLSYDSPDDAVGPLNAASEVGISEEGTFYAKAYGESSMSINPYWGYPIWTTASGYGGMRFTIDNEPLLLHWIAEGFEGYDETGWTPALYETGWSIELNKLTITVEGVYPELVYSTNSGQEEWPEGTQLLNLDPEYIYQLTWYLSVACSTSGDHDWAQLSLDLEVVPLPSAVILGILGLGMAGMKLRKKT